MKLLYKRMLVAIFVIMSPFVHLSAQESSLEYNPVVREELDAMFENLDKSKVPTGLLLDYAMDLIDLDRYDGRELTDSNYVDRTILEDLLRSVRSSSVQSAKPFGPVDELMDSFLSVSSAENIKLSFLFYRYNYIKSNALTDNLIRYDESLNKVYDVYNGDTWQNPYDERYVFACAPHVGACEEGTIDFSFNDLSNLASFELYFDADDGLGYRKISSGSTISVTCRPGEKELKLKAVVNGTEELFTHCRLLVQKKSPGLSGAGEVVPITDYVRKSVTYKGTKVEGQMTIYGLGGRTELRKPFIVVEGFDPLELYPLLTQFQKLGGNNPMDEKFGMITYADGYSQFSSYGSGNMYGNYDYVYIDWFNSTADIRANAMLLIEFIKEINERKHQCGSSEKNVIMGQSMGGLITRYALCTMENNKVRHEVSTFVSHDSPHLGANVPLGAIYFVNDLVAFLSGQQNADNFSSLNIVSTACRSLCSVLHSTAARQMLLNYVQLQGTLNNDVHDRWQSELNSMGFPKGDLDFPIKNFAISNGGSIDFPSTYVNNSYYVYFDGFVQTRFLLDAALSYMSRITGPILYFFNEIDNIKRFVKGWGSSRISISAEVKPFIHDNAGKEISKLDVKYKKKFLWIISKEYNIFGSSHSAPDSGPYYDEVGGSTYTLMEDKFWEEGYEKNVFVEYKYSIGMTNKIMFVPTVSSLCVKNGQSLTYSDFVRDYVSPGASKIETPFNGYFITDTASTHIQMNNSMLDWVYKQANFEIEGPERAKNGTVYSVPAMYGKVRWTSSDKTVMMIDENGTITITGEGTSIITAEYTEGQHSYKDSKKVVSEFPAMALDYIYLDGYEVHATSPDAESLRILNDMVSSGQLKYEWSFIDGDGNMSTSVSSVNRYAFTPGDDETVTVCLRVVDMDGNKGKTYSITFEPQKPFKMNYKYVAVNKSGEIYLAKGIGYVKWKSSKKYSAYFNAIPKNCSSSYEDYFNGLVKNPNTDYLRIATVYRIGNRPYPVSLKSSYNAQLKRWEFGLFDSQFFVNAMNDAIENCSEERTVATYRIKLNDSNRTTLQETTVTIICKPDLSPWATILDDDERLPVTPPIIIKPNK